jgi:hypothetical protein
MRVEKVAMRILSTLICVLALSVVGCSETSGTGGSGGDGGMGGDGGTGGMSECQGPEDCDDFNDCTGNACADGMCEYTPLADGTVCDESNGCTTGMCAGGVCDFTPVQDGTACGNDAGTCQEGSCQVACSEQGIRDAIAAGGGPHTFDCDSPTTVVTEGAIVIDNDVILDGSGELTLDGNDDHSLFVMQAGEAELRGFVLTNGVSPALFLAGGIESYGRLTIVESTVSNNRSTGVANLGGSLTLIRSTVYGNMPASGREGAGVWNVGGDLTLINSTVSANGGEQGAEIRSDSFWSSRPSLTIINSTVSASSQPAIVASHDVRVRNSVIDGICENRQSQWESWGHNIESPGDTCGFGGDADRVGVTRDELKLGALEDNGGPTRTHGLLPGSVAIDYVPRDACVNERGTLLAADQRRVARPQGDACDAGAFEATTLQCESAEDCDDESACTVDSCDSMDATCVNTPVADDTTCNVVDRPGLCRSGACVRFCELVECDDDSECTIDACDPVGGKCDYTPVEDGTFCQEGLCVAGGCEPIGSVFPCTEQGIRAAIVTGGGPFTFSCDGPTTIVTSEEIPIDNDVLLDGGGNLTVEGNHGDTLFRVTEDTTAELHGFTMTNASMGVWVAESSTLTMSSCLVAQSAGEGIYSRGTLRVVDSVVSAMGVMNDHGPMLTVADSVVSWIDNQGTSAMVSGSTIATIGNYGTATMTVTDSTISSGGISNSGTLALIGCTVSGNTGRLGGGIYNIEGRLEITNSTISGNQATQLGGAIYNSGTVILTNATIAGNTAAGESDASIFMLRTGVVQSSASLIDGECGQYEGLEATWISVGYNIESPGDTCGFDQTGDQASVPDPMLGPLQNNGGPTETHALLPGSPALDRIPVVDCEVSDDQLGVARPQGPACDVGAFELEVAP